MVVIIDYGLGNLGSILNMCKRFGIRAAISSDRREIERAKKLILPGVGAFDQGMKNLATLELIGLLNDRVMGAGVHILGICLGAQLMTRGSEEGTLSGLEWIAADTVRFNNEYGRETIKIPNMGWTDVVIEKESHLFKDMHPNPRFYFVHSYHFLCHDKQDILTTSQYGYSFTSAFERRNIVGVQFHPEKSHKFGMKLLQNFAESF